MTTPQQLSAALSAALTPATIVSNNSVPIPSPVQPAPVPTPAPATSAAPAPTESQSRAEDAAQVSSLAAALEAAMQGKLVSTGV